MKRIKQAGGVVINPDGKVLMVKATSNMWTFPKGKIESGEDEISAAKREIGEETGVSDLSLVRMLDSYERPGFTQENTKTPSVTKHIVFYLFCTGQKDLQVNDPGTLTAEWVSLEGIVGRLSHEKDKEFFVAHEQLIRQTLADNGT